MTDLYRPAYEILEVEGRQVLAVDLPGVDPRQVRLSVVDGNVLVISGRRARPAGRHVVGARPWGRFELRLVLPAPASAERLCVEFSAGVLEVELRPARVFDVEHPSTRVGVAGRAVPIT